MTETAQTKLLRVIGLDPDKTKAADIFIRDDIVTVDVKRELNAEDIDDSHTGFVLLTPAEHERLTRDNSADD